MNLALRIYLLLARAFPHEFKMAYGGEVTQLGEDMIQEIAKRHGTRGLISFFADIAVRVPLEYLDEMRRDMRYGIRALIKSPGFALVGIFSMGIYRGRCISNRGSVQRQFPRRYERKTESRLRPTCIT